MIRDRIVISFNSNKTGCCRSVAVNAKPSANDLHVHAHAILLRQFRALLLIQLLINYTNSDLRLHPNSRPFESQTFYALNPLRRPWVAFRVKQATFHSTCRESEF